MIVSVLEKLSLLPTFFILSPDGRFPQIWIPLIAIDLAFGVLFLVSFNMVGRES